MIFEEKKRGGILEQNSMKKHIPYILVVILAILLFRQCERTREAESRSNTTINYLTDSISYYKNKYGQEVAIRSAIYGEKRELELLLQNTSEQLADLAKRYRKLQAAGEVGQEVRIDTVRVEYEVPVPCDFFWNWTKSVQNQYTISGTADQHGITIDSLLIPNTLSFVVGKEKGKFTFSAINSNPLIKTTSLDAYTLDIPQRRFGISVFTGYGLSSNFQLMPILGVGVTYDLFQF